VICGDNCCDASTQQCCNGACIEAEDDCECGPNQEACGLDTTFCCDPGSHCANDYDLNPVCCQDEPCGGDQFCCAEADICSNGQCCDPKGVTSDGQCCGISALQRIACGTNCCDAVYEDCIGGECCNKTQVSSGGECCHFEICNGACCAEDEGCFGYDGGPDSCNKLTPV
jgi:hypothetical protein